MPGAPRLRATQPVPVRIGGFGGLRGLIDYLRAHRVTHLVDATHPFAATMSTYAVAAAREVGVPLMAMTRPAWEPVTGDRWTRAADIAHAVAQLAGPPRRVMLALGRMHVNAFTAQPQHHYLLRFVDAPDVPPGLPHHTLLVDRGPFAAEDDAQLMRKHAIELVMCKNAGGSGAAAKLIAARRLGLPVLMIDRPVLPPRQEVYDPHQVLAWLGHETALGV